MRASRTRPRLCSDSSAHALPADVERRDGEKLHRVAPRDVVDDRHRREAEPAAYHLDPLAVSWRGFHQRRNLRRLAREDERRAGLPLAREQYRVQVEPARLEATIVEAYVNVGVDVEADVDVLLGHRYHPLPTAAVPSMVAPSAYDTVAVIGAPALPKVHPSSGATSAPPWSVHTRRSEAVKPQPPYKAACEHSRHLVTGFNADPLVNASPRLALARRGGFPQAQGCGPCLSKPAGLWLHCRGMVTAKEKPRARRGLGC